MSVSTACPSWVDKLEAGETPIGDDILAAYGDTEEAQRALRVFRRLRIGDIPGTPTTEEAGCQWFEPVIVALFGSYDPEEDARVIREVDLMVMKKVGKTSLSALLMLTALLITRVPRQSFTLVSPTVDGSKLAFGQARSAVELDPALSRVCHCTGGSGNAPMRIENRRTGGIMVVKSFDARSVTGVRGSSLVDELHLLAELPGADRAIGQLRGALMADQRSFSISVTTQSERPPRGVFRAALDRMRAVRDGEVDDPSYLPITYEPPPGADPEAEGTWKLVLPKGAPVRIDDMRRGYRAAKAAGKQETVRWLSQHVNAETGIEVSDQGWSAAAFWRDAAEPGLTLDRLLAEADSVAIGIDPGGLDDMSALVVIGVPERPQDPWRAIAFAWLTEQGVAERQNLETLYGDFIDEGSLTITRQLGDDIDGITRIVERCKASGKVRGIGLDAYTASQLPDALEELFEEGPDTDDDRKIVRGIRQDYTLSGAILTLERKLAAGQLRHDGSALFGSAIGAVRIQRRGHAVYFEREAAAKIDAADALLNAAAIALQPMPQRVDVFAMIGGLAALAMLPLLPLLAAVPEALASSL